MGIGRSEADFCQVPSPPVSTAAHEAQSLDNHVDQASHCQLVLSMKQICKSESKNISEAYAAAKTRKKLQEEIHHQAFLLVQHALVRISLIFLVSYPGALRSGIWTAPQHKVTLQNVGSKIIKVSKSPLVLVFLGMRLAASKSFILSFRHKIPSCLEFHRNFLPIGSTVPCLEASRGSTSSRIPPVAWSTT